MNAEQRNEGRCINDPESFVAALPREALEAGESAIEAGVSGIDVSWPRDLVSSIVLAVLRESHKGRRNPQ